MMRVSSFHAGWFYCFLMPWNTHFLQDNKFILEKNFGVTLQKIGRNFFSKFISKEQKLKWAVNDLSVLKQSSSQSTKIFG